MPPSPDGPACPTSSADIATRSPQCSGTARARRAARDLSPFEIHDGVLAVLANRLQRRYGALVLDDLHWGDADTITALSRVARSDVACTVVAIARLDESSDQLLELVSDLERQHDVVRVRVGTLGRDDVADLLRATHGAHAATGADAVHERTGGHPLLLVQLLETGALLDPDLSTLPSSAEESIRRRIVALRPHEARRVERRRGVRVRLRASTSSSRSANGVTISSPKR